MTAKGTNLTWHESLVTAADRVAALGQRGATIWLTGLSGSGKSTIAHGVEAALVKQGHAAYVLDGDNVRHGLNSDLGFAEKDRVENIRRIGEVAKLFVDANVLAITAFISPFRADRDRVRVLHAPGQFIEVFVDCPLEACAERDPKGLYAKAKAGQIPDFTGISSPYEAPERPELVLKTADLSVNDSVQLVLDYLASHGHLRASA